MKILVTGAAGFIGFHLIRRLLSEGHIVVGVDRISAEDYYTPDLKRDRLLLLGVRKINGSTYANGNFSFVTMDLNDQKKLSDLCIYGQFDAIVHLAAQAGIRNKENSYSFFRNNVGNWIHLLEAARISSVKHIIMLSTSGVYSREHRDTDIISSYYRSKEMCEHIARSFSETCDIPISCLRFFTVYGPYGRPDMVIHKFVDKLYKNESVDVYGFGQMKREFTYIDDVVEGIYRVLMCKPKDYSAFNVGSGHLASLNDLIETIEQITGREFEAHYLPMQQGDTHMISAETLYFENVYGKINFTSLHEGLRKFIEWFKVYYKIEVDATA